MFLDLVLMLFICKTLWFFPVLLLIVLWLFLPSFFFALLLFLLLFSLLTFHVISSFGFVLNVPQSILFECLNFFHMKINNNNNNERIVFFFQDYFYFIFYSQNDFFLLGRFPFHFLNQTKMKKEKWFIIISKEEWATRHIKYTKN